MVIWYKLGISILICLAVGFFSSFFTRTGKNTWYAKLKKPSFNPPNWIFGPVWTSLYLCMGVALYFLWVADVRLALLFFGIQLVLNFFWSYIFFTLRSPLYSFIEIIILLIMIVLTMIFTYSVSLVSFWLFVPYVLWVSFASLLIFSIYILNK